MGVGVKGRVRLEESKQRKGVGQHKVREQLRWVGLMQCKACLGVFYPNEGADWLDAPVPSVLLRGKSLIDGRACR